MDTVCNLLFELSGPDRLDILMLLRKQPQKLSHVANKLNFTVQETSRNITRIADAKLIAKDVDGAFNLTPYGEEVLNLLSGYRFLFKNRDYFSTHIASWLPKRFETSIGLLEGTEQVSDVMVGFHYIEEMIAQAQESVWILTDQVLASTIPYLVAALERGAEFRLLMPKNYVPTQSIRELVSHPVFRKATFNHKLDSRFLEKIPVFLCLSKREVAAIGFPKADGKLDYTGFRSQNAQALEWARALFLHYWESASTQLPDQLLGTQGHTSSANKSSKVNPARTGI